MFAALVAALLSACGDSSPGPLTGTWQATSIVPMKATFRDSNTESLGVVEKVGYKIDGKTVIVTYKDGLMKRTSVRFAMVNSTTAQAMGMTYRKPGG